ncbi:MAG TPA: hypothetical protein VN641_10985, partial [Urbifossiella sp.]|nr:hypothetical protein [Urbifossiella sp.]
MSRKIARKAWLSSVGLGVGIWGSQALRGAEPGPLAPLPPPEILQAQVKKKDNEPIQPAPVPVQAPTPAAPTPAVPELDRSVLNGPAPSPTLGTNLTPTVPVQPAGATQTSIPVAASSAPQVLNASDLSQLLFKTNTATGIQFQQRNPLVSDPRIRGLRNS